MSEVGLAGVEIGTNINGVPVGDPKFLPFFQAAEACGAAIFVHALRPVGAERLVGPPVLEQALGFPTEVGLSMASILTGGTLMKCPKLRIAVSHGGGTLAQLLPRLQHAWHTFPALQEWMPVSPIEAARTMFYDDLVYDATAIRHLVQVFGASQLMLGSDYPFAIMDRDPMGRIESVGLNESAFGNLLRGNALRWIDGTST